MGGQSESKFGADYLRNNHLSQKFAELRCIEIILPVGIIAFIADMLWSS